MTTSEWQYGMLGVMLGGRGFHHLSTPVHMPSEKSTVVLLSMQADHAEMSHLWRQAGSSALQTHAPSASRLTGSAC